MKAKFKYGIKSYSGTLDGLNYANYAQSGVVIGRMVPENRRITDNNVSIGQKMIKISNLYEAVSELYKEDLTAYARKMFRLKAYRKNIAGNGYGVFVKMLWAASKDSESALDLLSLSVDDLEIGAYSKIDSVKEAVENGYLPKVKDYEVFVNSAK